MKNASTTGTYYINKETYYTAWVERDRDGRYYVIYGTKGESFTRRACNGKEEARVVLSQLIRNNNMAEERFED